MASSFSTVDSMLNSFQPDAGAVIGQLSGKEEANWTVLGGPALCEFAILDHGLPRFVEWLRFFFQRYNFIRSPALFYNIQSSNAFDLHYLIEIHIFINVKLFNINSSCLYTIGQIK